jgi:hypothetical protein
MISCPSLFHAMNVAMPAGMRGGFPFAVAVSNNHLHYSTLRPARGFFPLARVRVSRITFVAYARFFCCRSFSGLRGFLMQGAKSARRETYAHAEE